MKFLVIENVPGYMPDNPDPVECDDRSEAIHVACERAKELADDGYDTTTTSNDPFTIRAHRPDEPHDLGYVIQVVPSVDEVQEIDPVAAKVDEIVDQIEKAFGADGIYALDEIADDLGIGVVTLVEQIKNEIVARIAG